MIIFLITIMIMIINNYEDNDNCDNRETGGRHTLIFTSALRWKWNVDRENVIGNGNEWHLNHVFVNVGGSLRMGEYVRMITILHIGVSWDHKFDYGFPLRYLWLLLFEMSLGIIIFDKKAILSNLCHIIWLSLPYHQARRSLVSERLPHMWQEEDCLHCLFGDGFRRHHHHHHHHHHYHNCRQHQQH